MSESAARTVFEAHVFENAEGRMRTAVRVGKGKKKQANYPDESLKIDSSTDI
jgi:hypothetical protein